MSPLSLEVHIRRWCKTSLLHWPTQLSSILYLFKHFCLYNILHLSLLNYIVFFHRLLFQFVKFILKPEPVSQSLTTYFIGQLAIYSLLYHPCNRQNHIRETALRLSQTSWKFSRNLFLFDNKTPTIHFFRNWKGCPPSVTPMFPYFFNYTGFSVNCGGCHMQGQALDLIIIVGHFHLKAFCCSNLHWQLLSLSLEVYSFIFSCSVSNNWIKLFYFNSSVPMAFFFKTGPTYILSQSSGSSPTLQALLLILDRFRHVVSLFAKLAQRLTHQVLTHQKTSFTSSCTQDLLRGWKEKIWVRFLLLREPLHCVMGFWPPCRGPAPWYRERREVFLYAENATRAKGKAGTQLLGHRSKIQQVVSLPEGKEIDENIKNSILKVSQQIKIPKPKENIAKFESWNGFCSAIILCIV